MTDLNLDKSSFITSIQKSLESSLNSRLIENTNAFLHQIYESLTDAEKMKLDKQMSLELLSKMMPYVKISLTTEKSSMCSSKRCMARVGQGTQCSRSKQTSEEYCTAHLKSVPHGRIDEPFQGKLNLPKKLKSDRSGRKKVIDSMEGLNESEFIKTRKLHFEGNDYLVDENGIFYSMDWTHNIVAQVRDNKVYWFDV